MSEIKYMLTEEEFESIIDYANSVPLCLPQMAREHLEDIRKPTETFVPTSMGITPQMLKMIDEGMVDPDNLIKVPIEDRPHYDPESCEFADLKKDAIGALTGSVSKIVEEETFEILSGGKCDSCTLDIGEDDEQE